jgi:hypothetical protein
VAPAVPRAPAPVGRPAAIRSRARRDAGVLRPGRCGDQAAVADAVPAVGARRVSEAPLSACRRFGALYLPSVVRQPPDRRRRGHQLHVRG